jgi:hypothetical protein
LTCLHLRESLHRCSGHWQIVLTFADPEGSGRFGQLLNGLESVDGQKHPARRGD